MKTYEEYKNECLEVAENRSHYLRKGQAIFNYVDETEQGGKALRDHGSNSRAAYAHAQEAD